jgi:hypothetical protein
MDANQWVERKIAFDTAEDALLKLVKNAKEIAEEMNSGWYPFYPTGEVLQPNHKRTGHDRKDFNVDEWPTGNRIRDALVKCHEAYHALKECFEQLPDLTRKALEIPTMPCPRVKDSKPGRSLANAACWFLRRSKRS